MRWTGHIAHMGEIRYAYKQIVESLKGRDHLQDQDIDGDDYY
jgi:hypothetical protein